MTLINDFLADRTLPDLYQTYLSPLFETWSNVLLSSLPPDGRVLDIACGTGIVSRRMSGQPGVQSVTGIDVAPPMLEKAKQLSQTHENIAFQLASADSLPFADDHFQTAYCQQGLQFFPDRVGALKEARRVLIPGGRIALAVWTSAPDGNPVFGAFEEIVARELGKDLVPFGPFSLGDRANLETAAAEADLKIMSLEKREQMSMLPDPRSLVLFDMLFLGRPGPDGAMQPLFDPDDPANDPKIEAIISQLTAATSQYASDDGALFAPGSAHILVAKA